MKAARFLMSPEFLEQVLLLPSGVRVTHVTTVQENGAMYIQCVIEGDELPSDGTELPLVTPTYRREGDVTMLIGWDG